VLGQTILPLTLAKASESAMKSMGDNAENLWDPYKIRKYLKGVGSAF
jgi:hypothetical protein